MFDDEIYIESNITRILDGTLEMAKTSDVTRPWCVIPGPTGCGKTAATRAWLKHNNLPNVYIDACCVSPQTMEVEYLPCDEMPAGIYTGPITTELITPKKTTVTVAFSSDVIDRMARPDTVVVIDNYSWASQPVRDVLMDFIRKYKVVDPRTPGKSKERTVVPMMLVVIIETGVLATKAPLSREELKLFGLSEEYEQYIKDN